MEIFDNISKIVKDDMKDKMQLHSRVSIAAACFSMYAYKEGGGYEKQQRIGSSA